MWANTIAFVVVAGSFLDYAWFLEYRSNAVFYWANDKSRYVSRHTPVIRRWSNNGEHGGESVPQWRRLSLGHR
jgi:hypothetical protein